MSPQNANCPVCARCRQPLPEGSGYCVGCGFQNNTDALHSRKLTFDEEMNKAHAKQRFCDYIAFTVLGMSRWFR